MKQSCCLGLFSAILAMPMTQAIAQPLEDDISGCLRQLTEKISEASTGKVSCYKENGNNGLIDLTSRTANYFQLDPPSTVPEQTILIDTPEGLITAQTGPYRIPILHFSCTLECPRKTKRTVNLAGAFIDGVIRQPVNAAAFEKGLPSRRDTIWYHDSKQKEWEQDLPVKKLPEALRTKVYRMAHLCTIVGGTMANETENDRQQGPIAALQKRPLATGLPASPQGPQ